MAKENTDALALDSVMGAAASAADALDGNITLQTEAKLLESDTLALRTIDSLQLERSSDFAARFHLPRSLAGLFPSTSVADRPGASLEDSPRRRSRALKIFSSNLRVGVVPGTRLIEIHYLSKDPQLAADVVNQLMQELGDYSFQTRFNATNRASGWLGGQLSELKRQTESLQAKVIETERQSGVVTLGLPDEQGKDQAYSAAVDQLQQSAANLSQATANRIVKQAIHQVVASGDPELISGLTANGLGNGSSILPSSLSLLQNLRAQEASSEGELSQNGARLGPAHPRMQELHAKLSTVQAAIHQEIDRIGARARNDYESARRAEDQSRREFESQKHRAESLNNKAIEYAIVRQEADDSRGLYEDLLKRLKEAGVLAGLRSTNIAVVDPGRVPAKPRQPNMPLICFAALLAGCVVGGSIVVIWESLDGRVQSLDELDERLEISVLAVLPLLRGPWYKWKFLTRPNSPPRASNKLRCGSGGRYTEALRSLRTALLLHNGTPPPKVLLVTSPMDGEGKSTVSSSLASLLARGSRKVLLVDADLRKPTLESEFKRTSHIGLSQLLEGISLQEHIVQDSELSGLHLLTSGPKPADPAELFTSFNMQRAVERWRAYYDFIILDAPPVLPVTDAVVLSNLSDLTLLVARQGVTEWAALLRSKKLLEEQSIQARLGVVFNGVMHDPALRYRYGGYTEDAERSGFSTAGVRA